MKNKKKMLIIGNVLLALFLILVIVVNSVALYWSQALLLFFGTIGGARGSSQNLFSSTYGNQKLLLRDLEEFVKTVVDEGAILLKNENTLPLPEGERVTLFGQGSVNWLTTGTGSSAIQKSDYPELTLKSSLEDAGFRVNGAVWDLSLIHI